MRERLARPARPAHCTTCAEPPVSSHRLHRHARATLEQTPRPRLQPWLTRWCARPFRLCVASVQHQRPQRRRGAAVVAHGRQLRPPRAAAGR
eukprot:7152896-Prymnesium_polylepis.1